MESPKKKPGTVRYSGTYTHDKALHDSIAEEAMLGRSKKLDEAVELIKEHGGIDPLRVPLKDIEGKILKVPARASGKTITKEEFDKMWEFEPPTAAKASIMGMDSYDFVILRELLENYKKRKNEGRRSKAEEMCDRLHKQIDELRTENKALRDQIKLLDLKIGRELATLETKFDTIGSAAHE